MRIIWDKYTIGITAILVIGIFIRVQLSRDNFLHKWDERYHALVSANLLENPLKPVLYKTPVINDNYEKWYASHVWMHKQPLPLWLIAASYSVFGKNEFNTRIPSILLSSLSIIIIYLLGVNLFNKKIALLSAFFLSVNGLIIELCAGRVATDHYDSLFLAFILIAIHFAFLAEKKENVFITILTGIFLGFALLTKHLPALIVIPVHIAIGYFLTKNLQNIITRSFIILITAIFIAFPWQIYALYNFPKEYNYESSYNWLHFTTVLDGQGGGLFYYLEAIRINYSEIIYLPLIFLFIQLYKTGFKNYLYVALAIWIFIPLLFFTLAQTKMQGYILFTSPALFLITADFFYHLLNKLKYIRNRVLLKCSFYLLLTAIIFLPLRYCFERTGFGFKKIESENYHLSYKVFSASLPKNAVIFNVSEPIEFMFYNNCIAYSDSSLSNELKNNLIKKDFSLFMYNPVQNTVSPIK